MTPRSSDVPDCPRWGTCFSHDCTCHPMTNVPPTKMHYEIGELGHTDFRMMARRLSHFAPGGRLVMLPRAEFEALQSRAEEAERALVGVCVVCGLTAWIVTEKVGDVDCTYVRHHDRCRCDTGFRLWHSAPPIPVLTSAASRDEGDVNG